MQVSAVPHSEVLALQGLSSMHGKNQDSNQIQDMNAARLNWKANLTCYKCGEKGYLAHECPYLHSSAITQRQQTPLANTKQANYTCPTLFPAINPFLSQTINVVTQITSDIWQTLMKQLNKVNHDNKLLKKAYKNEAQQNQV